ncbi:hypothetical protein Glove_508g59 [Diversispora epigaea]|uniref:Uncharacterized protein n=1 Tax=Diversispora epigaea TaxID=1348612 RepID=A0A397GIG7_9GLOM|nr:hypothetical protein Glove_508g59 [Diversispora epigaea]
MLFKAVYIYEYICIYIYIYILCLMNVFFLFLDTNKHVPPSNDNKKYNKFGLPPKPSFLNFNHKPESTNNLDNKSSKSSIIDSNKQDLSPKLKLDDIKKSDSKSNSQSRPPPKLLLDNTKKGDLKSIPQYSTAKSFDNTKYNNFDKRNEAYKKYCKKTEEALDLAIDSIFGDNKKSGSKQNLQSRPSDDFKKKDSLLRPSPKLLIEENKKNCNSKKDSRLLSFHDFMKNANSECADSKRLEQDKQERLRLHKEERSYRFNPYPMEMPMTMRRHNNPCEIPGAGMMRQYNNPCEIPGVGMMRQYNNPCEIPGVGMMRQYNNPCEIPGAGMMYQYNNPYYGDPHASINEYYKRFFRD